MAGSGDGGGGSSHSDNKVRTRIGSEHDTIMTSTSTCAQTLIRRRRRRCPHDPSFSISQRNQRSEAAGDRHTGTAQREAVVHAVLCKCDWKSVEGGWATDGAEIRRRGWLAEMTSLIRSYTPLHVMLEKGEREGAGAE